MTKMLKANDKNIRHSITPHLVAFTLWFLYIGYYGLFGIESESYYLTYLFISFILAFSVYSLLKSGKLTPFVLYISIVFMGLSESVVVVQQYFHFMPSNSAYFSTTGTGINPNIAAMIICLSIPAGIELTLTYFRKYVYWSIPCWITLTLALFVTQCRTVLLALIALSVVFLINYFKVKTLKIHKYFLIALPVGLILIFGCLQLQKKDSSDSRLTIWKISSEMIVQKPMSGYGYGLFEKAYNIKQANYFNYSVRPEYERMNASFTAMAYNEYLEQFVMGGILGCVFFVAVLFSLIWGGWQNRKEQLAPLLGVLVFSVMCLFNFTVECPSIFFIFLLYASVIMTYPSVICSRKSFQISRKVALVVIVAAISFTALSLRKYVAQQQLTKVSTMLKNGQCEQARTVLTEIEPDISTSESFYRLKAHFCFVTGDLLNARLAILKALEYTSNPFIMQDLAQITFKMGNISEAEFYLHLASGIEPHLFRPRVILMEQYRQTGQILKTKSIALEILSMKPKINSEMVKTYKQMAKRVILGIENNKQPTINICTNATNKRIP